MQLCPPCYQKAKLSMRTHEIFSSRSSNVFFEPVSTWEGESGLFISFGCRDRYIERGRLTPLKTSEFFLPFIYWPWMLWALKVEMVCIGESKTMYGVTGFLVFQQQHRGHIWGVYLIAATSARQLERLALTVQACHWWHTCAFYSRWS